MYAARLSIGSGSLDWMLMEQQPAKPGVGGASKPAMKCFYCCTYCTTGIGVAVLGRSCFAGAYGRPIQAHFQSVSSCGRVASVHMAAHAFICMCIVKFVHSL
jgi:hypothetical protein